MNLMTHRQLNEEYGISYSRLRYLVKKNLVSVVEYGKDARHQGLYNLNLVLKSNALINETISEGLKRGHRKNRQVATTPCDGEALKTVLEYRAEGMKVVWIAKRLGMRWQDVVAVIEGAKK